MKPTCIALTLLAAAPAVLEGQNAQIGDRVRVSTAAEASLVGILLGVTPEDLRIEQEAGELRIPADGILTIERSLGEHRRFVRNFLLTTAVGALAGGVLTAAADDGSCTDAPLGCLGGGGSFAVGSIVGGIVSLPIGLIVGLSVRSERWEPATAPPPAGPFLSIVLPGARRGAVGFSVVLASPW